MSDGGVSARGVRARDHATPAAAARGHLLAAAVFHALASARNRLRARLARLRSPRTLLALVVGAAYLWWFLIRRGTWGDGTPTDAATGDPVPLPLALPALAVTLLAAKWWLVGADPRALAFTPAETSLLFPAPVTRRALVQWKLWRAQGALLLNVVLWTVILRGGADLLHGTFVPAPTLRRALALWLLFTALYLHRLGAALRTAGWRAAADDGRAAGATRWRWWLAQALVVAGVAAIAAPLWQARAALRIGWIVGLPAFLRATDAALAAPPAAWVLAPARALLAAVRAAPDAAAWPAAVGLSAALVLAHYLWVVRTDVAVHEVALAAVERGARGGLAPWRRRARPAADATRAPDAADAPAADSPAFARRRAPRLAPTGHPAVAILWKNGVAAWRSRGLVRVLGLYAVLAAGALPLAARDPVWAELVTVLLATWGAMLVLGGPLVVRTDLRQDLAHLALLRAFPLRGRDVVLAEVLASTLALTAAQLALLLLTTVASAFVPVGLGESIAERVAWALGAACALPAVNLGSLLLHNAAALLFPAWVRPAGAPARGVEATGQGLVGTAVVLALLAVLLALPAALAWGAWAVLAPPLGHWAFAPAALLGSVATALELWPAFGWLGRVFERTDPNEVGAAA